jgi:hypothetical protein
MTAGPMVGERLGDVVLRPVRGHHAFARRAMEQHCDDTAALLRGLG